MHLVLNVKTSVAVTQNFVSKENLGNIGNTCQCPQQMFLVTRFLILPWLKTDHNGSESKVLFFVCLFLEEKSIGLFLFSCLRNVLSQVRRGRVSSK